MKTGLGALATLLLGLITAGCGDSEQGSFCCTCVCCEKTATLKRQDQTWPECGEPCNAYCANELACARPVQSAQPCAQ